MFNRIRSYTSKHVDRGVYKYKNKRKKSRSKPIYNVTTLFKTPHKELQKSKKLFYTYRKSCFFKEQPYVNMIESFMPTMYNDKLDRSSVPYDMSKLTEDIITETVTGSIAKNNIRAHIICDLPMSQIIDCFYPDPTKEIQDKQNTICNLVKSSGWNVSIKSIPIIFTPRIPAKVDRYESDLDRIYSQVVVITNSNYRGSVFFITKEHKSGDTAAILRMLVYDGSDNTLYKELIKLLLSVNTIVTDKVISVINTDQTIQIPPYTWKDVYLTDEYVQVKEDLEFFLANKNWYIDNNIPYKRGYLLVGPPGNGKSLLSKIIMNESKFEHIYTYNFISDETSNTSLIEAFTLASEHPSIMLLEDIDRVFETLVSDESKTTKVTKDILLNCLDGFVSSSNMIVIATANKPELLDKAFTERPGRFDCIVRLNDPDITIRENTLLKLFKDNLPLENIKFLAKHTDGYNMASLKEILILTYQNAFKNKRRLPTEEDSVVALKKMDQYYSACDNKNKVGF